MNATEQEWEDYANGLMEARNRKEVHVEIFIGIDPGKTGGMAILFENGGQVYDYDEIQDGLDVLKHQMRLGSDCYALIEKQQAMPKQGVVSMFKLGENYGKWQGWLEMLGIQYEIITPVQWRKQMFDSMPRQDKKAMSLDLARRLFPKLKSELSRKKDHGRAEALLLAGLCRRRRKGG